MKLAVLDFFSKTMICKDPYQLVEGLSEIGHQTTFIPVNKLVEKEERLNITVGGIRNPKFWSMLNLDAVIFISRFNPELTQVCKAIKESKTPLILKADSDGTLGYPLVPNYLRTVDFSTNFFLDFSRHIKWRLPISTFVKPKLKQIEIADAVIIESPNAKLNAQKVVRYWLGERESEKIEFIPNPLNPVFTRSFAKRSKKKKLTTVGRWEDCRVKNTKAMCTTLSLFAEKFPEYEIEIIGTGVDEVNRHLLNQNKNIKVTGPVNPDALKDKFAESRILFMPSKLESFGLAAAEALCMGCSVVASPIESLQYFCSEGKTGTLSKDFDSPSYFEALCEDEKKWESGFYNGAEIETFWRNRLDRKLVAQALADFISKKIG